MARKVTRAPKLRAADLTLEQIQRGIQKIAKRITELAELMGCESLEELERDAPSLARKIDETLSQVFGSDTEEYARYRIGGLYGGTINVGYRTSDYEQIAGYRKGIEKAATTLNTAVSMLEERLEDLIAAGESVRPKAADYARKAFIVHGHDIDCRNEVELFLRKLNFDYIILNQQPNSGRTVIEKIEQHSDVGFAIILLTPDDTCQSGEEVEMRARQNVMWEYGYFVGRLNRARVCVLKKGDVKIPSDLEGIGWTSFDAIGGWHVELARELRGAGYSIDMNQVI
jgi:predicted nucleotide-binding protein